MRRPSCRSAANNLTGISTRFSCQANSSGTHACRQHFPKILAGGCTAICWRNTLMIDLLRAAPSHRSLLRQLYELYCHDFSPMTKSDLGDDGYWTGDDFLDPWPDNLHVYLIRVDQQWAGFAWIAFGSYSDPQAAGTLMDEFFVLRKYRRRGVGEWAAV